MAKQTFTTGQVLTAAQMTSLQQTAMGGGSATAKTASYVLVAADAGTVIQMNAAGATIITVNTALFAAGDSVQIQNIGAGVCTVTAGTATVTTAGSLALSQWEGGQLYFTSTSASIFFDIVQSSGMTNPLTTTGDTIYSSSGTTAARLGIGSTSQVLTVAGGVPTWATPSSGGGMTLITDVALSAVSSYSFTSIPQTYKQLYLVWQGVKNDSASNAFSIRVNSNSSNIYKYIGMANASPSANSDTNLSEGGYPPFGYYSSTGTAVTSVRGSMLIDNYTDTNYFKYIRLVASFDSTTAPNARTFDCSAMFCDTTAITEINIIRILGSGTLSNIANTSVRLYGIS